MEHNLSARSTGKFNDKLPSYFTNYFKLNEKLHSYNTRTASNIYIDYKRTNYGKFSLKFRGAQLNLEQNTWGPENF